MLPDSHRLAERGETVLARGGQPHLMIPSASRKGSCSGPTRLRERAKKSLSVSVNVNEAQFTLTDTESELLRSLARETGRTEQELFRDALGIIKERLSASGEDRLASLRQAMGIWKNRDDLPILTELRSEMNREFTGNGD